jgi:hypothetical protein
VQVLNVQTLEEIDTESTVLLIKEAAELLGCTPAVLGGGSLRAILEIIVKGNSGFHKFLRLDLDACKLMVLMTVVGERLLHFLTTRSNTLRAR